MIRESVEIAGAGNHCAGDGNRRFTRLLLVRPSAEAVNQIGQLWIRKSVEIAVAGNHRAGDGERRFERLLLVRHCVGDAVRASFAIRTPCLSDQLSGAAHIPSPIQQNASPKACQQQGIIGLSAVTRACNGMLESRSIQQRQLPRQRRKEKLLRHSIAPTSG
ncbi:hypothetical protein NKG99_28725 [Mesorhizobium sp. M1409]|uniref:hypothetical protein n=1 Tax=unclassified Mesorhizobium TaxID=325217 RepID=UPI0033390968